MDIKPLEAALDEAKQAYLNAKGLIDDLRNQIAQATCPIRIGDRVAVTDAGNQYDGKVEYILPAIDPQELLDPIVGARTGWVASGHRFKLTTGELGTWGFGISSLDAKLEAGRWVTPRRTLDDFFGLAPMPEKGGPAE